MELPPFYLTRDPREYIYNSTKYGTNDSMSQLFSFRLLMSALLLLTSNVWAAAKGMALIEALQAGELEKARTLIASGADANAQDEKSKTVLSWAAEKGSADIITLLIKKGARINERDEEGMTALMYAAAQGNVETLNSLLKAKADLNIIDQQGRTA